MPYPPETVRVELRAGERTVSSHTISRHPPQVDLLSPNGGESIDGELSISWSASDSDGDLLRFLVQYSADNGKSWKALSVGTPFQTLTFDSSKLSGSEGSALIRVIATDGLHTAIDLSDTPFSVAAKPPEVSITGLVEDGSTLEAGSQIRLLGEAFDREEGFLPEESLTWHSDRDGTLGQGRELVVPGLSVGKHRIFLRGTDRSAATGEAEIQIEIFKRSPASSANK